MVYRTPTDNRTVHSLSTPSLGITYRGHPAEGSCDLLELSTPSLGITE